MQAASDELFRALGDPTRRAIFERLVSEGEQTVRALTDHAGISQPAVSKHLGVLKTVGLVRDRPEGRQVHYSADPKGLDPARRLDEALRRLLDEKLDRLEKLLEKMDP